MAEETFDFASALDALDHPDEPQPSSAQQLLGDQLYQSLKLWQQKTQDEKTQRAAYQSALAAPQPPAEPQTKKPEVDQEALAALRARTAAAKTEFEDVQSSLARLAKQAGYEEQQSELGAQPTQDFSAVRENLEKRLRWAHKQHAEAEREQRRFEDPEGTAKKESREFSAEQWQRRLAEATAAQQDFETALANPSERQPGGRFYKVPDDIIKEERDKLSLAVADARRAQEVGAKAGDTPQAQMKAAVEEFQRSDPRAGKSADYAFGGPFVAGMYLGKQLLGEAAQRIGTDIGGETGESLRQYGFDVAASGAYGAARQTQPKIQSFRDIGGVKDFVNYALGMAGQGLGTTVPIVGAAVVNPALAGATAFGYGIGDVSRELGEAGVTNQNRAAAYSYVGGAIYGALDTLVPYSVASMLKEQLTKPAAQEATKRFIAAQMAKAAAKSAGEEGITEAAQEVILVTSAAAAKGDQDFVSIMDNATRAAYQERERILEAGIGGAFAGGPLGGAGKGVELARTKTAPQRAPAPTEEAPTQAPVPVQPPAAMSDQPAPTLTTPLEKISGVPEGALQPSEPAQAEPNLRPMGAAEEAQTRLGAGPAEPATRPSPLPEIAGVTPEAIAKQFEEDYGWTVEPANIAELAQQEPEAYQAVVEQLQEKANARLGEQAGVTQVSPETKPDVDLERAWEDFVLAGSDNRLEAALGRQGLERFQQKYGLDPRVLENVEAGSLEEFRKQVEPELKGAAPTEQATSQVPSVKGFTTAKGSTYQVHEDGTTTRDKSDHSDVGHDTTDVGLKPRSAKTIYVDANIASALSAAGVTAPDGTQWRVVLKDGKATLVSRAGRARFQNGPWGAAPSSRDIPFSTEPAVGKAPVELWKPKNDVPGYEAYGGMHAGNAITSVESAPKAEEITPPAQQTEPTAQQSEPDFWTDLAPILPQDESGNTDFAAYHDYAKAQFGEKWGFNHLTSEQKRQAVQHFAEQKKAQAKEDLAPHLEAVKSGDVTELHAETEAIAQAFAGQPKEELEAALNEFSDRYAEAAAQEDAASPAGSGAQAEAQAAGSPAAIEALRGGESPAGDGTGTQQPADVAGGGLAGAAASITDEQRAAFDKFIAEPTTRKQWRERFGEATDALIKDAADRGKLRINRAGIARRIPTTEQRKEKERRSADKTPAAPAIATTPESYKRLFEPGELEKWSEETRKNYRERKERERIDQNIANWPKDIESASPLAAQQKAFDKKFEEIRYTVTPELKETVEELRGKFDDILSGNSPQSRWGDELGESVFVIDALIADAISRGKLTNIDGKILRTKDALTSIENAVKSIGGSKIDPHELDNKGKAYSLIIANDGALFDISKPGGMPHDDLNSIFDIKENGGVEVSLTLGGDYGGPSFGAKFKQINSSQWSKIARLIKQIHAERKNILFAHDENSDAFEIGMFDQGHANQLAGDKNGRWRRLPDSVKELPKKAQAERAGTQAAPKTEPTPPQWALDHAKDIGGSVVWHEGDLALLRGFSVLTGEPVYAGAKDGVGRTHVDIKGYTGKDFTADERARLRVAREEVILRDEENYRANPDGPFGDAGFAASASIPQELAGYAENMLQQLGIRSRVYLTTVDDTTSSNFSGPYAAIASAQLDPNSNGSTRRLANGDHYVALKLSSRMSKNIEVLAHEMGHILEKEAWEGIDQDTQSAIFEDYAKWLEKAKSGNAKELIESLRAHTTGKTTRIVDPLLQAEKLPLYWTSFSEWFADNVAKWAVSSEKPLTIADRFFSRLAAALRSFYEGLVGSKYLPAKSIKEWLDTRKPGDVLQGSQVNVEREEVSRSLAEVPGGPEIKSLAEIIADLKTDLGMPATQGLYKLTVQDVDSGKRRFFRPKAPGQYDNSTGASRYRLSRDIDTIARQGAAHIERVFPELDQAKKAFDYELDPLSIPGAPDKLSSGFAEFFKNYITDPDRARNEAPGFYDEFEDLLDALDPKLLQNIESVQLAQTSQAYQDYRRATTLERMRADLVSNADRRVSTRFKNFLNDIGQAKTWSGAFSRAYEASIDDKEPHFQGVKTLLEIADANGVFGADGRPITLAVHENPYKLSRSINDAFKIGLRWLQDGMPNYHRADDGFRVEARDGAILGTFPSMKEAKDFQATQTDKTNIIAQKGFRSPSIHDALTYAFGREWTFENYQNFGGYLEARRGVEEWKAWDAKQAKIKLIEKRIRDLQSSIAAATDRRSKDKAKLERRSTALVRTDTLLKDARRRGEDETKLQTKRSTLANEFKALQAAMQQHDSIIEGLKSTQGLFRDELKNTKETGLQREPHMVKAEEFRERIQQLEAENPKLQLAAGMVYDFLWQAAVHDYQAGRLTKEELDYRATRRHFYVPWARDMSDLVEANSGRMQTTNRFSKDKATIGSDRPVINPLETIADQAFHRAAATYFNDMILAYLALIDRVGPGSAAFGERVTQKDVVFANEDGYNKIKEKLLAMGYSEDDAKEALKRIEADLGDTQLLLKFDPQSLGPKRPLLIPYWQNGERGYLRINDVELAQRLHESINGIGREMANFVINFMAAPAKVLRIGATIHPGFVGPNIMRDMMSAFILTGRVMDPKTWPVVTQVKGLYNEIAQTDFAKRYQETAGLMGGQNVAALSKVKDKADVLALKEKGLHIKIGRAAVLGSIGGMAGYAIGGPVGAAFGATIGVGLHRGPTNFWDSISHISDMSETATRLGVASSATKAAMENNPNLTPFQAFQEGAYVSRDVLDFGRSGSKMRTAAKIVTFLNANLQGLDKLFRDAMLARTDRGAALSPTKLSVGMAAAGAAGTAVAGPIGGVTAALAVPPIAAEMQRRSQVVRELMAPFGKKMLGLPLSQEEDSALANSARVWINLALVTAAFMTVVALYKSLDDDDPTKREYDDIASKVKNRAQPVKIFGQWYAFPKPFEFALPSIFFEAAIDAQANSDPNFWKRAVEGVQDVVAPPVLPQAWRLWGDISSGYDTFRQKQIVPENLKLLPPEMQYKATTSQLAIDLAAKINGSPTAKAIAENVGGALFLNDRFHVSPLLIDYALSTGLGYWGKDAMKASNVGDRSFNRVSDTPLIGTALARFELDPARASQAMKDFWETVRRDTEGLPGAAGTYSSLLGSAGTTGEAPGDKIANANAYLATLNPIQRSYALVQTHGSGDQKRLCPINRMRDIGGVISELQQELVVNKLQDSTDPMETKKIELSSSKRAELSDILSKIAAAEAHNTMKAMGYPRYTPLREVDTQATLNVLKASDPRVAEEYQMRLERKKVQEWSDVKIEWPLIASELNQEWQDAAAAGETLRLSRNKKFKGGAR